VPVHAFDVCLYLLDLYDCAAGRCMHLVRLLSYLRLVYAFLADVYQPVSVDLLYVLLFCISTVICLFVSVVIIYLHVSSNVFSVFGFDCSFNLLVSFVCL